MTKAERQNKKCRTCGKIESAHPGGAFCKTALNARTAMFVLTQDDDGHAYVVPSERLQEFSDIVEAIGNYWSLDNEEIPEDDDGSHAPQIPAWAIEVGGAPSLVEFPSFSLNGRIYTA